MAEHFCSFTIVAAAIKYHYVILSSFILTFLVAAKNCISSSKMQFQCTKLVFKRNNSLQTTAMVKS
jgi:hypothetical protein